MRDGRYRNPYFEEPICKACQVWKRLKSSRLQAVQSGLQEAGRLFIHQPNDAAKPLRTSHITQSIVSRLCDVLHSTGSDRR